LDIARRLAERIATRGFPNYYGEQRFGRARETAALGFDLIAGRKSPRDIHYSRRKFLLRLSLSAAQSELFNRVLAARLTDGLLATVLAGDVMEVVASGGKFLAENPAVEQPRCDAGEIVVTGPMFGPKMKQPIGVPAEREAKVLSDAGLTLEQFAGFGEILSGTRRPLVIRPGESQVDAEPEGLRFTFTLPPGVYATTLLAEIVASEGPQEGIAD
jgi:tRNA pseudouridine13 synthase